MLNGADSDRRDKGILNLNAGHGALQVGNVRLHRLLADVLQWPDAGELAPPDAGCRGPLRREVLGEVLALAVADRTCHENFRWVPHSLLWGGKRAARRAATISVWPTKQVPMPFTT